MTRAALRLAQALLVLLTLGGATAFAVQIATWPDHPLADMTQLTWWARMIQREGLASAYAGTYPETYVIYPPGMAYAFQAAGALSERVPQPSWLPVDDWLRLWVKLIAVAGHAALAFALFVVVAAAGGFWRGWLAATLYVWNPAALFDTAYWGQADSLHTLAVVLALAALFAVPGRRPARRFSRLPLRPLDQSQEEASKTSGETSPQPSPLLEAEGARNGACQRARAHPSTGDYGRLSYFALCTLHFALAVAAGAACGAVLAAGGLTKPQAWVFLPLVLWLTWRRTGLVGLVGAAIAGSVVSWWMLQPWIRAGRLDQALSVFQNLQQVMPSVSANGHNLWWLKLPGVAISVLDWDPLGGAGAWHAPDLLTFSTAGRLLFGAFALLALLRLTGPLSQCLALACAAYTAEAYFMAVTQVHENHMFAAVPLLAAAAALDAWFVVPFAVATVCTFFNLTLHDFLIGDWLATQLIVRFPGLPWHDPLSLQTANAALNVAGFALFTLILLRRPAGPPETAQALAGRARLVLLAGLAIAGGALGALLALFRRPDVAERLWQRLSASALQAGPVEAHLGHRTPQDALLVRAAMDYANLLYALAGVAAIAGAWAVLAGTWWLVCARAASRGGYHKDYGRRTKEQLLRPSSLVLRH